MSCVAAAEAASGPGISAAKEFIAKHIASRFFSGHRSAQSI
jgi:hypothetical protein